MTMQRFWGPVLSALLAGAACASHKEPAAQAITELQTSINALREDAMRYAPQDLQRADAAFDSLNQSMVHGEYKDVVDAAPILAQQLVLLRQKLAQRKREAQHSLATATRRWETLSAQVPQLMQAIERHLDDLDSAGSLPPGVSLASLRTARDNLQVMKSAWSEALAMFSAGNTADAVTKAQAVTEKGRELASELGLNDVVANAPG